MHSTIPKLFPHVFSSAVSTAALFDAFHLLMTIIFPKYIFALMPLEVEQFIFLIKHCTLQHRIIWYHLIDPSYITQFCLKISKIIVNVRDQH